MERIRIGTNIGIVWHIFVSAELGESFVLKDKEDFLKIYIRSPHDIYEVPYFTVEEDTIKLSFPGQFQRYTGVHAIVLKDTTDGERTVCKDFAFELIKHLEEEGEAFEDNEEKKILALNSSILVSKQGESAYEVWLRMGNTGSQEDFFKWLRGGQLVNYNFKKPLRSAISSDGVNYDVWIDGDSFSEAVNGQFIRKDIDDEANGIVTFNKGLILGRSLFDKGVLSNEIDSQLTDRQIMSALGTLRLIEKYLSVLADKYIRKDIDDEAKGLITFLAGLKSESLAVFLSGMAVSGMATFNDSLGSANFWTGWSGYGWKLWMKDTVNIIGNVVKRSTMEIDELTVRGTFRVFEFVINQLRGENDNYVFAGMQKVDHVDVDTQTIYLDTNKGETYCPFREGDILRCQRFQYGDTVIKRYDLLVKEAKVGDISDGEDRVDYIIWEKFDGNLDDIDQGDVLVRLDNKWNVDRKGIITTTSIGNGAPYIDVLYGLITNPEESLKVRLGKLDGIVNSLFGELSGYGLYSNNAFLTGEFYLSTGEAVETKIRMLENLFSSSMSKTTYDIKEDDNIVQNCAFVEDMRGWTTVDGDDMDLFFIDDDTPVFMNEDMMSEGHSVASMENVGGKEILHLLDAGVSQANALFVGRVPEDSEVEEYVKDAEGNIVKNEDGTLKTETKTIRPTIYISYRYMCKESGSLSIGFNNGRTTEYSSDMGVIVSVNELGTLTENVNTNDGVWIERQYKGYYDKLGDFTISTTGEVYIDVLAVTSKPLNDFKNVVSTALIQTAGAIGLYGRNIKAAYDNIGGLDTSITELGVQVNAEAEKVDIFVNKTYPAKMLEINNRLTVNEEGISATAKTVEGNTTRIGQLEVSSDRIGMYVTKTRTAGAELVYNSTVTIRTDEDNKTATILDYIIYPTFLIANEEQTITNIQIAEGSGSGNPHLEVVTSPFGVKVVCAKGVVFTEPVLLEAVVTVTRDEENVYGETEAHTYQRSMFITVYPSTKGETGYRGAFKSTVFKRSLTKPAKPTGGSYDNPVPLGWSDGIPSLADGEANYQIWASSKVMYDYPSSSDWSDPAAMTDTADFDVEFSSLVSPSAPTGHPNTNAQWSNNADESTLWMATSSCKNGVWSDWEVIYIKGEQGVGIASIVNTWNITATSSTQPTEWLPNSPAVTDEKPFLWRKMVITYTDGTTKTDIALVGAKGAKGVDGTSVEYIYTRTTTETTPSTPSTSQSDDYVPSGWDDDPQGVTSTYKFEYVSSRTKTNGVWSAFSTPSLWAKYSEDGNSVSDIVNYYLANTSSTAAPTSGWKTSASEAGFSSTNKYLWNYEEVKYSKTENKTTTPRIIAVWGEKGNTGTSVTGIEEQYALSTSYSSVTGTWSASIPTLTSTNKYLWNRERIAFDNGTYSSWSTPVIVGVYGDQGVNGFGFVAALKKDKVYTEAELNGYFTLGNEKSWTLSSTDSRNGCRVGDIFMVSGRAKDTLNMHVAYFRSTTGSGNLQGICISHDIVEKGDKGETGAGEVWSLVDAGSYAYETADEKIYVKFSYNVVRTIDGTSATASGYTVKYRTNLSTGYTTMPTNNVINAALSPTYSGVESFTIGLFVNDVLVDTISIPVKLQAGAFLGIIDSKILAKVQDPDTGKAWWSVEADRVQTYVTDGLSKTGIDITNNKITISSPGQLVINTGNLTLDASGNVTFNGSGTFSGKIYATEGEFTGKITATSGKIGIVNISSTGALVAPYWEISSAGKLWCVEATISGEITATGGTFDRCTINDTCIITKIEAVKGTIGSWSISSNKLSTNVDASLEVEVNGKRFLRINSPNDGNTLLVLRNDEGTAASFNAYGDGSVALTLNGQAGDGSYALKSYGDVILSARAGEHIAVTGLSLSVIDVSTTKTLTSDVDVVTFSNTSAITVTMPPVSTNKGKVIFMKRVAGSGTITLSGSFYNAGDYDTTTTSSWVNDRKSVIYVSDGKKWISFYCG